MADSLLYLHKGLRGAKPMSTPNLCQMAQECHSFLHLRGDFLPTHLGLKGAPLLLSMTSEPVAMPRKHTPESQEGPFFFLHTTSKAFPFYCQVLCEFLIRAAGSELSLS